MAKCWFSRNGFFWISKKKTNFLKFVKISLKREFLYLEMDCHETDPLETVFLKRDFLTRDSLGTDSLRISRISQKRFFHKGFFRKGFSRNLKKDWSLKKILSKWVLSRFLLFPHSLPSCFSKSSIFFHFFLFHSTKSLFWFWKLTASGALCSDWLNKIGANNFQFSTI